MQRSGKAVISRLLAYHVPESKTREAQRARIDPIFFGERYVKPHDARWTSGTQQFQVDMVHHLLKGSRFDPDILIKYPRPDDAKENSETQFKTLWIPIEHAKTTWMSIVIPLWILALDQEAMGYLIGNRQSDAVKSLGVIRWHIENNQLLRAEFPELRPDYVAGWSDTRIFVERKSKTKDPNIDTTGITGTIQGTRLDWVFGDDVQDRTRALSEIKNQGDQEMWQEIIENRVVDGGICASYGTLQTGRDLTATLSRSEGYQHMHLSAIDNEGRYGSPGSPLWMTKERLDKALKRQGQRRFARKYLNDATDEGGKLLKADLITFVSHEQVPWQSLTYYAGVDPATGETEVAEPDEYAIAWGGKTPDGRVYLLGTMGSPDWNIADGTRKLAALHTAKKFRRVAVEAVSFSIAAKQDIWRGTNVPAYKSPTASSKELRFETMSGHFEIDRVLVYEGGPGIFGNDEPGTECFYDQWIDFNEGVHDDRLDAVEKMLEAAMISRRISSESDDKISEAIRNASLT